MTERQAGARQGVVRRSGIGWKSGLVGLAAIGFAALKLL